MTSIAELNNSLGLPEQDPREVVYNSALNREVELSPSSSHRAIRLFSGTTLLVV
jgi:hypothetical protein